MILIADVNPYVRKKYKIPQFSSNTTVTAEKIDLRINDNLINIFRIFNIFDIETELLTYLGGENGEIYKKIINKEISRYSFFSIKDNILEILEIYDNNRKLNISSKEPRITNEELNELISLYAEEVNKNEYIIVGENSNSERIEEIISNLIKIAYKSRVKFGISTNVSNIEYISKFRPYLIVIDKETLEKYSNKELNFLWESNLVIKSLMESGIAKILYYNNKNNLQLFTKENIYSIDVDEPLKRCYKDMLLSGYIASKCRDYDEEMALSISLACAKIEEKEKIVNNNASSIKEIIKDVKVEKSYVK